MSNQCTLRLLDLYFEKCDFMQQRSKEKSTEYNFTFKVKYAVNSDDESKIKVVIDTTAENSRKTIITNLVTVGIFNVDKSEIDDETYEQSVKENTVAIIFPYIRSQLSLLTTQPGIEPILIPPVNINALINSGSQE